MEKKLRRDSATPSLVADSRPLKGTTGDQLERLQRAASPSCNDKPNPLAARHSVCRCLRPLLPVHRRDAPPRSCRCCRNPGCSPYSSRQTCFAPRYGSSQCDSHDRLLGPDCADANGVPLASAPAHCNLAWCYVDRVRVVLLSAAMLCIAPTYSNLTAQHRSSPIGTCGSSIDAWKDFTSSSEQGRGKTLRIGCARQSLHELPHDTAHLPRFSCPLPACVTMHPNQAFALVQHSCARLPEPLQAERLQPRGSVRQR